MLGVVRDAMCRQRELDPVRRVRPVCEAPHLVRVIGKVDLVEDLGSLVLDGLHLHQVWGVLPGAISENTEGEREGSMLLGPHGWEAEESGDWPQPDPHLHSQQWTQLCGLLSPEFPDSKWDGNGARTTGVSEPCRVCNGA